MKILLNLAAWCPEISGGMNLPPPDKPGLDWSPIKIGLKTDFYAALIKEGYKILIHSEIGGLT